MKRFIIIDLDFSFKPMSTLRKVKIEDLQRLLPLILKRERR